MLLVNDAERQTPDCERLYDLAVKKISIKLFLFKQKITKKITTQSGFWTLQWKKLFTCLSRLL